MIILIAKLDEQFENFKSPRQREQINEENVGKKWLVQWRPTSCFYYISKKQVCYQELGFEPTPTRVDCDLNAAP